MRHNWRADLSDKLTDAFIHYQWNLDHPFPASIKEYENTSQPPWITKYQTDSVFHAKVMGLTAGVMDIVVREIDKAQEGE